MEATADPNPTFDVCVIGSANLDVVSRTPRIPAPGETVLGTELHEHAGGKGLNQAVAAARSGASTAFVGAVGNDEPGQRLRNVLIAEGISPRLTPSAAPTGRAIIAVDDDGENSIIVIPGANADVVDVDPPLSKVALAQLEVPLPTVASALSAAQSAGSITILNPAPATPLSEELLRSVTYLIPNEHELDEVGGAELALAAGCRAVIVTLGGAGVDVVTAEGTTHIEPFPVTPIDTTGAGDAFCGSFATRIAAGDDLLDAVRWAAAAGALATTVAGAVPGQPHAAAITSLIDGARPPKV